MQRNEINQSVYYTANVITREVSETSDQNIELNDNQEEFNVDDAQITFNQLIDFVGSENIQEIWAIKVGNALKVKHHILLLKNRSHICSCLSIIRCGIVCRHYFQLMLNTSSAMFHIRMLPSR